jgi:hypothetical protein
MISIYEYSGVFVAETVLYGAPAGDHSNSGGNNSENELIRRFA